MEQLGCDAILYSLFNQATQRPRAAVFVSAAFTKPRQRLISHGELKPAAVELFFQLAEQQLRNLPHFRL